MLPGWSAFTVHVPALTIVSEAPDTVHTAGVADENATARPDVAVAVSVIGAEVKGWLAGPVKLIACPALCTVSTNDWEPVPEALVAVKVSGNVPTVLREGVPARTPVAGVNVTPAGSVPVIERVGAGLPVPTTVNVPACVTVNVVEAGLVITGAVAAPVGVTPSVFDATLVPAALVAVTEQVYGVPFARPLTTMGEAPPALVKPPGLQTAV